MKCYFELIYSLESDKSFFADLAAKSIVGLVLVLHLSPPAVEDSAEEAADQDHNQGVDDHKDPK